ncbi:E3 ubiquitin-protein ligase TRIM56 [Holothuria leucospilota]|uniref:E3 ubiquitin-protein ligase TRIM56 n=1 Tax=Holothuria leucospilota TaxID=206669 RepID=A0A9Q1BU89_HOLLE|nr:E3 ubiquitin-protein ligase TRIM56 [Holothuria leucospilota]
MAFDEEPVNEILKLYECTLCNDELKIPKLLPCLHRFCKECLQSHTEESQNDGFFTCPTCEAKCEITEKGVDDFNTDIYLENIVDAIRTQTQLVRDQTWRKCGDCLNFKKMYSYCFACKESLCVTCRGSHKDHGSPVEGESAVVDLENIASKGFSVKDLLALPKSSKCPIHESQILRLVCFTCKNMIICDECAPDEHILHQTRDLKTSAEEYFRMLEKKMESFRNYGSRLQDLNKKLQRKVSYNKEKRLDYLHTSYAENNSMILTGRSIMESEADLKMAQIEAKYDEKIAKQRQLMEDEIQKVKDRFEKIFEEIRKTKETELDNERAKKEDKVKKIQEKEEITEHNYRHLQVLSAALATEENEKVTSVLNSSSKMFQRYEKVITTATRVLASRDDCEAVKSIPDILAGVDQLTPDMSEISNLENFASEPICKYQLPSVNILAPGDGDDVEKADSVITLRHSDVFGKDIDCITVNLRFGVVISGHGPSNSHISCMDINGKIIKRKLFKNIDPQSTSNRSCAPLSDNKMATICSPDEIGICDLNDWSYRDRRLTNYVKWPKVRCVTTDQTLNRILVGSFNCRNVFIFDEDLNYLETITLVPCRQWPYDMCVKGNQLLVCDHSAGKAFATDMKGNLIYKFIAPSHELANWKPRSICADKRGLVYILWQASDWSKSVVVQYRQQNDGVTILRRVDKNAACITIMETDHETNLLVITKDTGTLYVHSLVQYADIFV